jgi:peroxiredoxin Q/BCP
VTTAGVRPGRSRTPRALHVEQRERRHPIMATGRLVPGKKAPAFTLAKEDGTEVSLKDFAGTWVVLYFYPKDDTPGCTTEACEFTDSLAEFADLDAVVLGCSPDTPESHRRFIAKHRLNVTLLSDPEHNTMAAYGAWGEKSMYGREVTGVVRSTVIIGPDGAVAHHWPNVKAAGHAQQVRARLADLQRQDAR